MAGMTAGQALLESVQGLPNNYLPPMNVQAAIEQACMNLSSPQAAEVVLTLLGAAPSSWCQPPPTALSFPDDHAVHPGYGPEWYWLTAVMQIDDSSATDTFAFVLSMERQQPVSQAVQQAAGWSDTEAQLAFSYACVIHRTADRAAIYARRPNLAWPPLTGTTAMSQPGEPFLFACGPDSLSGTVDVMPLSVTINDTAPDEDPLIIEVTCSTGMPAPNAFFLQGNNGVTPPPRAGTYYSWPQLKVSGQITVGGRTYTVSGKGWLDHEMMYGALPPVSPIRPQPPQWTAPPGIYGWSFCDFNFDNGCALVLAGFQEELLLTGLPAPYGFFLTPLADGWSKTFVEGEISLEALMPLKADCMMPVAWSCIFGRETPLFAASVTADPVWYDGSFLAMNMSVQGETPVRLTLSLGEEKIAGTGYCESVGYEPPARFMARALAFLASQS
jgi:predicted secreted hydrolase